MAIQQPRFVDGRSLAVDLQTPANAIAGGLTRMFDNQRQDQQAMAKQQQFDQANAVNAFAGSILQSDPQSWPEMFMAEASRYEQMGDMQNADEARRLAQLPIEEQTREMQQDFMSSSNALGRDPIAGLRQISGAGQKDLPSDVRETIWFNQQTPEVQKQHLELKRKAATDYAAMAEYQKTLAAIKAAGAGDKVIAEAEAESEVSSTTAATAAEKEKSKLLARDAAAGAKAAQGTFKTLKSANRIYDNAIAAIDKGAESGAFAKMLPTFKAETIELQNAIREAGLNTISGVTLGAINKAELELALAVDIPEGMDEKELKPYLQRKKKANIKLMKELNKMSSFLSKPGNTVAMWNEKWGGETDFSGIGLDAVNPETTIIRTQADYDALPSGSIYTEEDGKQYRKP